MVVVEGETVRPLSRRSTMLAVGIVLSVVGLGFFCWLLFTLAIYALPTFALCGRPHKATYVAFSDMWPARGECYRCTR